MYIPDVNNVEEPMERKGYQLVTDYEGSEQINTFQLVFNNLKFNDGKYPTEKQINMFLKDRLLLKSEKITRILFLRVKKAINISF